MNFPKPQDSRTVMLTTRAFLLAYCLGCALSYSAGNILVLEVQQAANGAGGQTFTYTELDPTSGNVATSAVAIPSGTCQMSSQYSDGRLTLSEDGSAVSFTCYDSSFYLLSNIQVASLNRVIGFIGVSGTVTCLTLQGSGFTGGAFSSAVRLPSGAFYAAGVSTPKIGETMEGRRQGRKDGAT